jgi:acetate kinase
MSRLEPVWVFNAGSSSIKCAIFDGETECVNGQIERIGAEPRLIIGKESPISLEANVKHAHALDVLLSAFGQRGFDIKDARAVGHRIVHGGTMYQKPVELSASTLSQLQPLRNLAPLHNGFGLDIIERLWSIRSDVRQVACFDTAFHSTMVESMRRLPIPEAYAQKGYRRYGFHGINYEFLSEELQRLGAPSRVLAFHLGNGCSIAAIENGKSVATTMGYSTLEGLVMGTRTGSIDPGVIISLLKNENMSVDQCENLLYRQSGLLGMSGISNDMRTLLASADPAARGAVEHFIVQAARQAAGLVPCLGDVDALVFSGGIGYGAAEIRARIVEKLSFLGFKINVAANDARRDRIESLNGSKPIYVIAANEEKMLARHVYRVLMERTA